MDNKRDILIFKQKKKYSSFKYQLTFVDVILNLKEAVVQNGPASGQIPFKQTPITGHHEMVALTDSWSVTSEIISFYQRRILQEGFINSAVEKRSFDEWLRLFREMVAINLAASARIIIMVKETSISKGTCLFPAGLQLKSQPKGTQKSAYFFTDDTTNIHAAWNKLAVQTSKPQTLTQKSTTLFIQKPNTLILKEGSDLFFIAQSSAHLEWGRSVIKNIRTGHPMQLTITEVESASHTLFTNNKTPTIITFKKSLGLFGNKAPKFQFLPDEIKRKFIKNTGGFFAFNRSSNFWENRSKGLGVAAVYSLAMNSKGFMFAATNAGVYKSYNRKVWGISNSGISDTTVRQLVCVKVETVDWIFAGTDNGVYQSNDYGLHWHYISEGLENREITSLALSHPDTIIAGTKKGLYELSKNAKKWKSISHFKDMAIHCVTIHSDDRLLVGTPNGIYLKRLGFWSQELEGVSISALLETKDDDILAGSSEGLYQKKGSSAWKLTTSIQRITCFGEDPTGVIYLGTQQGLYCSTDKGQSWIEFGFAGMVITAITIGPKGELYVSAIQHVMPSEWPGFEISGKVIELNRYQSQILPGSFCLIRSGNYTLMTSIVSTKNCKKSAFMLNSMVSQLTLADDIPKGKVSRREAEVLVISLPLHLSDQPITDPLKGNHCILPTLSVPFQEKQQVYVEGYPPEHSSNTAPSLSDITNNIIGEYADIQSCEINDQKMMSVTFTHALTNTYDRSSVRIYGNTAAVTQGAYYKAPIGGGNGKSNQIIKLNHNNILFYRHSETKDLRPSLNIWINDILWQRVVSLFDYNGNDHVYELHVSQKGELFIRFGDGIFGALVPMGKQNIHAEYYYGSGSDGNIPKQTLKSIIGMPPNEPNNEIVNDITSITNPEAGENGSTQQLDKQEGKQKLLDLIKEKSINIGLESTNDIDRFFESIQGICQWLIIPEIDPKTQRNHLYIYLTIDPSSDMNITQISSLFEAKRFFNTPYTLSECKILQFGVTLSISVTDPKIYADVRHQLCTTLESEFNLTQRRIGQSLNIYDISQSLRMMNDQMYIHTLSLSMNGHTVSSDTISAQSFHLTKNGAQIPEVLVIDPEHIIVEDIPHV